MNTQTAERQTERGTITVQKIFPSKGNGKPAYIKDVDGMLFGVWPDKLGLVREGDSYEIEFSAKVVNGTTYRDIKGVKMITPERAEPQASTPAAKVGAPKGNDAGGYRPTHPRDSERMFTCSILNAFISTGRIDCERGHLSAAINELRAAYAATFGQDD